MGIIRNGLQKGYFLQKKGERKIHLLQQWVFFWGCENLKYLQILSCFHLVLAGGICHWDFFFHREVCVLSLLQDDQDEVNQNYLADEEEEAEEEAQVMTVPGLEEEEEEEEGKEEEEEEREEEGQGQPTGNAWWRKLQIVTEYLWDPEKRMSLARTGQSRSESHSFQCPSLLSLAFDVVSRAPQLHTG